MAVFKIVSLIEISVRRCQKSGSSSGMKVSWCLKGAREGAVYEAGMAAVLKVHLGADETDRRTAEG